MSTSVYSPSLTTSLAQASQHRQYLVCSGSPNLLATAEKKQPSPIDERNSYLRTQIRHLLGTNSE